MCNEVTVTMQILLCSSWWNIPTWTLKTQLASMWSISCNIQHLAQQQSQLKIQCSMFRKWAFHPFQQGNTANRWSDPHHNVIKLMKATAAWRQEWSQPSEHCTAYDLTRSLQHWNGAIHPFWATKTKRNGWRIVCIERPLWQGREFKTQSQRLLVHFLFSLSSSTTTQCRVLNLQITSK